MNAKGQAVIDSKCSSTSEADIGEATVVQILRVGDLLTRIGDSKVFGKDLTQAQFNILMILKRHGEEEMSQKDILANCVSTKGNVSIHMTNLTHMGYVRRKTSKVDSRINVITLTAKGRRILAELEPKYVQHLKKITDDLPFKQAETAIKILDRLRGKCEDSLSVADDIAEQ